MIDRGCRHEHYEVESTSNDMILLRCLVCGKRRIGFTNSPNNFIEERDELFNKYITDFI